MSEVYQKMGVIGGGSWGTAMAQTLATSGRDVTLWTFEEECAQAINTQHENTLYLKDVPLSPGIRATTDMADLTGCEAVLMVTPAQHMRSTIANFIRHAHAGLPVMLCSKGIEISSLKFMSQVLEEVMPQAVPAVLSGPSFAIDVAQGLPTAVTLACADANVGAKTREFHRRAQLSALLYPRCSRRRDWRRRQKCARHCLRACARP